MSRRPSSIGTAIVLVLVLLVVLMAVGQHLGQPIVLGYVVTGSMSPALEAGDGFVAIPPSLVGDVGEGDVVTFEAEEIQGGGLVTHRIVGENEQGYVTAGDANPFVDQDAGERHVQDHHIVAVALQIDGQVVRVRYVGQYASMVQGALASVAGFLVGVPLFSGIVAGDIGTLMVGAGLALLLYTAVTDVRGNRRRDTARARTRKGMVSSVLILGVILLLIIGPATASMVIPSGVETTTIISSSTPNQDPLVIQRGGSSELNYSVTHSGYFSRVVVIEPASDGVEISQEVIALSRGESVETIATVHAPEATGAYERAISERQYVGLLPTDVIVALHRIHPWVAIVAIDSLIAIVVSTVYVFAVGLHPIRLRDAGRDLTWVQRARRSIRKWR